MAGVTYKKTLGYENREYQCAIRVEIEKTTIISIVSVGKFSCEKIWQTLGRAVALCEINRAKLYEEARNLNQMCQIEEIVLDLIHDVR